MYYKYIVSVNFSYVNRSPKYIEGREAQ